MVRWRVAVGSLGVLAMVPLVGCSGAEPDARDDPGLGRTALVAICLTDDAVDPDAPQEIDLCALDLTGRRHVLRADVDPESPALAPDRRRIAFVADGTLHLVDVDGGREVDLGVEGRNPEWLDAERLAAITPDGRAVVSVTVDDADEPEVIVGRGELPASMGEARIEWLAISRTGHMLLTLFEADRAGSDDASRFGLASRTPAGEMTLLLGPGGRAYASPDFSPRGDQAVLSIGDEIRILDLDTHASSPVSPSTWVSTSPVWSPDGTSILWLADGVEGPDGPAVLATAEAPGDPYAYPEIVVASAGEPFDELPVRPDW